ncbi:MAG: hypothetical protein JXA94_00625 [Parachlamydiales bacterium]|nr:hypothetical protein [Parachlamydiales bacterium]
MAAITQRPHEASQTKTTCVDYDTFFSLCEKVQKQKKNPLFVGVITFKQPGDDLSDFSTKIHYGLIKNYSEETANYKIYAEIMFGKLCLFERGDDIISRNLMSRGLQSVRIISRKEIENHQTPQKVQEATFFEELPQ